MSAQSGGDGGSSDGSSGGSGGILSGLLGSSSGGGDGQGADGGGSLIGTLLGSSSGGAGDGTGGTVSKLKTKTLWQLSSSNFRHNSLIIIFFSAFFRMISKVSCYQRYSVSNLPSLGHYCHC